ncbi:hypothetical protein B0H34DRAFT_672497 [Crassisporium funariophilum]|nr:hypothetical protein B0H34DRAFT_672497 [Crassisporium funariophilum]
MSQIAAIEAIDSGPPSPYESEKDQEDQLDNEDEDEDPYQGGDDDEFNLFRDEHGFRIGFFLHKSIKRPDQIRKLTEDIERHGGTVLDTDEGADTVVVHPNFEHSKQTLQISYNADDNLRLRKVWVEFTTFIQQCIRDRRFRHVIPQKKGMGGPMRGRVSFTQDDDLRLIRYLARLMPDKKAGGRLGLNVYIELVQMATVRGNDWAWTARHTPESWKQRYKMRAAWFDQEIAATVAAEPVTEKQLWHENRTLTQAKLRRPQVQQEESDEEEQEEESEVEILEISHQPQKRRRSEPMVQAHSPPDKRQRIVRKSAPELMKRSSNTGKGKERVVGPQQQEEEEEDGPFLDAEDHYEDGEPGPSAGPSTPSLLNTQDTLDGTAPPMQSAKNVSSHADRTGDTSSSANVTNVKVKAAQTSKPVSSRQEPPRASQSGQPQASTEIVARTRQSKAAPPSNVSLREQSSANEIAVIPPQSQAAPIPIQTAGNPPPSQDAPPSSEYQRPSRAARRPRSMVEPDANKAPKEAPFRNTRSRLRSIEPSDPPKKEQKERDASTIAEEDEVLQVADDQSAPIGETLADEMDVENFLIAEDHNQSVRQPVREALFLDRASSMSTDDQQTEQALRSRAPSSRPMGGLPHPADILREYQASSNRFSPFPSQFPELLHRPSPFSLRSEQGKVRDSLAGRSRGTPIALRTPEPPHTPAPRLRGMSTSSTESKFPVTGSRARALKKNLLRKEKISPFKALSGTRASQAWNAGFDNAFEQLP